MKRNNWLTALIIICSLLFAPELMANIPEGPGGDPDAEVPLDGGVSLLVAAGVAYGAKKAYDKRKKDKEALKH